MQEILIRMATLADDAALTDVDQQTWSASTAPTDRWPADQPFFTEFAGPELVVVAPLAPVAVARAVLRVLGVGGRRAVREAHVHGS